MPRRGAGIHPSGNAEGLSTPRLRIDVSTSHQHGRTAQAPPLSRFLVRLHKDFVHLNGDAQFGGESRDRGNREHPMSTIRPPNDGDLYFTRTLNAPSGLDIKCH